MGLPPALPNLLGENFASMVQRLQQAGTLDSAFQGLGAVLQSVNQLFLTLIEQGIRGFTTAAPGIAAAVNSISGALNKFDFTMLGSAVGAFFQGIADGINKIPQSTIDSITSAFQSLGEEMKSPEVQSAIQTFAAMLPSVIGSVEVFVRSIAMLVDGFRQMYDFLNQGDDAMNAFTDGFANFISSIPGQFMAGLHQIGKALASFASDFVSHFMEGLGQIGGFFAGLWSGILSGAQTAWPTGSSPGPRRLADLPRPRRHSLPQTGSGLRLDDPADAFNDHRLRCCVDRRRCGGDGGVGSSSSLLYGVTDDRPIC
jgi:phage-related protein